MFACSMSPVKIIHNVPYGVGVNFVLENKMAIGLTYSLMNTDLEL